MTSLQSKLQPIGAALAEIVPQTFHYWRPVQTAPWLIWAEDGENGLSADGQKAEQGITGTADYYTKQEYDPNVDAIQTAFDQLGLAWYLSDVFYEDTTNLIHYSWTWEVC